ncbi:mevalonate kinase [candidate division KSB1 bacterium]|nr:mevalonate kinase [candidate division KSB1 bacterium]
MRAIAPGKIILSGEHAVVYGNSALVMAINLFSETVIKKPDDNLISIHLTDFNDSVSFSFSELRDKSRKLKKNYDLFVNGRLGIRHLVDSPADVFAYLIFHFFQKFAVGPENNIDLTVKSDLPVHCGMGSSASTIISLLIGLAGYFSVKANSDQIYELGLEGEKFLHGFSSGVDPYVVLYGGLNRFQKKKAEQLQIQDIPLYIVNTGPPEASTGESVEKVAGNFSKNQIWTDFQTVTDEFEKAYCERKLDMMIQCVRENHKLLSHIGVVPPAIRDFISGIERHGGAAKISGAGSVRGQNAGVVMIISEDNPKTICEKYGYELFAVTGEPEGARIV